MGLCTRNVEAYRDFLNATEFGWFYRGIDDTWISPPNLAEFVSELTEFVNPSTDIVIKACKTWHPSYRCGPWTDGGIGWLLSRADVRHVLEYDFLSVCDRVFFRQDDTSMGMIACHTFPDHRFWHSWRMPGNAFYGGGQWPTNAAWARPCPDDDVWPLAKLIVLHANGHTEIENVARTARGSDPALAYHSDDHRFELCRADPSRLEAITSKRELRRWTPIVEFCKGGQKIPWPLGDGSGPVACRQCAGLHQRSWRSEEDRLSMWNAGGWIGFWGNNPDCKNGSWQS
jgi:hypothetical protein